MAKNDYELGRKAGYEQGWKAGYDQGWSACMDSLGRRRRLAALKYTDAPEVKYKPGPPPRFAADEGARGEAGAVYAAAEVVARRGLGKH